MFWDLWLALQFWIKLILYYMFLLGSEAIIFFGICMTDVTWGPRICWVDACIPGVVAETLTASGSYPYEFGHRVARLHTTFMESKPGYGVTSDLDALFKSGYQDCTLYQLTGCFCCEPLSVWICLWCGLGVNVLIYIYIYTLGLHLYIEYWYWYWTLSSHFPWVALRLANSWKDPGLAWQFADLVSLKEMLVAAAQAGKYEPDPLLPFDLEPSEELFKRYVAHYFSHG